MAPPEPKVVAVWMEREAKRRRVRQLGQKEVGWGTAAGGAMCRPPPPPCSTSSMSSGDSAPFPSPVRSGTVATVMTLDVLEDWKTQPDLLGNPTYPNPSFNL